MIKGFNASRINNEDTARIQALLPSIVNHATKEIKFTGKVPDDFEMDKDGKIWVTAEQWHHEEGKGVFTINKHTAEQYFGKSEDQLTPEEKDKVTQKQMDHQLHADFHTIYTIVMTEEDQVEIERICDEGKKGWEKKISDYAQKGAEEGTNDEVFCECGVKFMTEIKETLKKPTELEKINKQMYDFIKDRLERLGHLSDFLGGQKNG